MVKGWDGPWGIGDFTPGERFAQFAPPFGLWSLLMHAKTVDGCLSRAGIEAEIRLAVDYKLIKRAVTYEEIVDARFAGECP